MNKKFFFIIAGIFGTIYLILLLLFYRKGDQDLALFISTKLDGKIVYIYSSSGGERFRLDNSKNIYNFTSIASYFNNYTFFDSQASIGDSVIKPAYSDTLLLIEQSGKRYKYTFYKSYKKSRWTDLKSFFFH